MKTTMCSGSLLLADASWSDFYAFTARTRKHRKKFQKTVDNRQKTDIIEKLQ